MMTMNIRIANDSIYGLSGAVFSGDDQRAISVAKRVRTGNDVDQWRCLVWGRRSIRGYKQSGIGREMGVAALEHLEESVLKPT